MSIYRHYDLDKLLEYALTKDLFKMVFENEEDYRDKTILMNSDHFFCFF